MKKKATSAKRAMRRVVGRAQREAAKRIRRDCEAAGESQPKGLSQSEKFESVYSGSFIVAPVFNPEFVFEGIAGFRISKLVAKDASGILCHVEVLGASNNELRKKLETLLFLGRAHLCSVQECTVTSDLELVPVVHFMAFDIIKDKGAFDLLNGAAFEDQVEDYGGTEAGLRARFELLATPVHVAKPTVASA
jgi:hypothetical protein